MSELRSRFILTGDNPAINFSGRESELAGKYPV